MRNSDIYLKHFIQYLRKPFDIQTYCSEDGEELRLATFDSMPKLRIYASLGLSDQQAKLKDLGEVILLSDDFRKDVVELYVNMLLFILQKGIPLGTPFSIGGIEMLNPEFAEYYDKAGLYFARADLPAVQFGEVRCGYELGGVYQALFVSYAEMDLLNRSGAEELEARLRAAEPDRIKLFSLNRPSCV